MSRNDVKIFGILASICVIGGVVTSYYEYVAATVVFMAFAIIFVNIFLHVMFSDDLRELLKQRYLVEYREGSKDESSTIRQRE